MNRQGFERGRRRAAFRLTLEHLESRRLMAGLSVFVYSDQDGSRTHDRAVDSPVSDRLVYVDLNRSGRFDDGEPLAVSGNDGLARFPNLAAGSYTIALAGNHPAQIQTTSIASDPIATFLRQTETSTLLAGNDLAHVWSISSAGNVTAIGSADRSVTAFELGGPIVSVTNVVDNQAWALVNRRQVPTLLKLDLTRGTAVAVAVDGLPAEYRPTGLAMLGTQLAVQLESKTSARPGTFVGVGRVRDNVVTLGRPIEVPTGEIVGSPQVDRFLIVDDQDPRRISSIGLTTDVALIETAYTVEAQSRLQYSLDGTRLYGLREGGGLEVFSNDGKLKSQAYLAEAGGPVSESRQDGRLITGNANIQNQLIIWDTTTWRPISRIQLPENSGTIRHLSIDAHGENLIVSTESSVYRAALANPTSMAVDVAVGSQVTQASFGVRVLGTPAALPSRILLDVTTPEDITRTLDLMSTSALADVAAWSNLVFTPSVGPRLGSVVVSPSGQVVYRPMANVSGKDSLTLKVYDGISSSSLVISLNVAPVNDPPSAFTVDLVSIAESSEAGTGAGFATVFDVDADARYLITTSDERFTIVDGQVIRSEHGQLDFETEPNLVLDITATDLDNPAHQLTRRVAIPISNSNDGPVGITVITTPVLENSSSGEVTAGEVLVEEIDEHGAYIFTVSDSRFEVVQGQLRLKPGQELDFEFERQIIMSLSVFDPTAEIGAVSRSATVTVDVLDANDPPTAISLDSLEVKTGEPGAVVGMIDVSDQDSLEQYTFEVSDPRFVIDGHLLRLNDGESLSTKDQAKIPVLVTANDGKGNVISQTVTVTVVNDAPYQNPKNPLDVDNDGGVYPRDVLFLINILNNSGPHVIESPRGTGESTSASGQGTYIDVNGDGAISAIDALIIINYLNTMPHSPAEGEGDRPYEGDREYLAPPLSSPFEMQMAANDERESIDGELEMLLEQLSREQLRS